MSSFFVFIVCAGTTDIIFILDSSSSVGIANYNSIKSWVNQVIDKFPIHSTFYVGVVVYTISYYDSQELGFVIFFTKFKINFLIIFGSKYCVMHFTVALIISDKVEQRSITTLRGMSLISISMTLYFKSFCKKR